jgi:hypothetical protein
MKNAGSGVLSKIVSSTIVVGFLLTILVFQNCGKSEFHTEGAEGLTSLNTGEEILDGIDPDSDGDGLKDSEEKKLGTDPDDYDTDGDGLCDGQEVNTYGTDPLVSDTDKGGINDGDEVNRGTNPLDRKDDKPVDDPNKDTDGDGLKDKDEAKHGTDKNKPDTDGDGLTDGEEVNTHKTNPLKKDTDGGTIDDGTEVKRGTDPLDNKDDVVPVVIDTDKDGLSDEEEVKLKTDPKNPDSDSDGLKDGEEVHTHKTNPLDPDTDDGGVKDGIEVKNGKNPLDPKDDVVVDPKKDSDNDGLTDIKEKELGTDPNSADTDKDGLKDGAEVLVHNTNPLVADTDGGGVGDGDEVSRGSNPLDPKDDKPSVPNCEETKVLGLWLDPKNTKDITKAQFVGEVKPFKGDLDSVVNYGYASASANPKVGPAPEKNVFHAFLYEGKDGVNLTMYAGQDEKGDDKWESVSYRLTVQGNRLADNVKLSDDQKELRLVEVTGDKKVYSIESKYINNTDGGVVGPFVTHHYTAHYELRNTEEWKEAYFVSANKKYSLGKAGAINHFIVGYKKEIKCKDDKLMIELKKKPEAVSEDTDGEFMFTISPENTMYSAKCSLDDQVPVPCEAKHTLIYRNLGVGKHRFKVRVETKSSSINKEFQWEIVKPKPIVFDFGPWSEWKNVTSCVSGRQKQERTRQACVIGISPSTSVKKICRQEIEYRSVDCGGVSCPQYMRPRCADHEELIVEINSNGCSVPRCVPRAKAANRWCHMKDEAGKIILGYKDDGAVHKAGCNHVVSGQTKFYAVGSVVKHGDNYIRCDSGPATEYPLKDSRCKPSPVMCPQYMPPRCKEGQELVVETNSNGCPVPRCVDIGVQWVNSKIGETQKETCARARLVPATDSGFGICASGEDRPQKGANAKSISYLYGIWGSNLIGGTEVVDKYCYQKNQKRDSDKTDLTVAYLCKTGTQVSCPRYMKPLCKDNERLVVEKDARGCEVPRCEPVPEQLAANRWCHMRDQKGTVVLGYMDKGAVHKAGCYYNVGSTKTFYKVGSVVKYQGRYIRCDSAPKEQFPVPDVKCKKTYSPFGGEKDGGKDNFGSFNGASF